MSCGTTEQNSPTVAYALIPQWEATPWALPSVARTSDQTSSTRSVLCSIMWSHSSLAHKRELMYWYSAVLMGDGKHDDPCALAPQTPRGGRRPAGTNKAGVRSSLVSKAAAPALFAAPRFLRRGRLASASKFMTYLQTLRRAPGRSFWCQHMGWNQLPVRRLLVPFLPTNGNNAAPAPSASFDAQGSSFVGAGKTYSLPGIPPCTATSARKAGGDFAWGCLPGRHSNATPKGC